VLSLPSSLIVLSLLLFHAAVGVPFAFPRCSCGRCFPVLLLLLSRLPFPAARAAATALLHRCSCCHCPPPLLVLPLLFSLVILILYLTPTSCCFQCVTPFMEAFCLIVAYYYLKAWPLLEVLTLLCFFFHLIHILLTGR
jgi:hypothetical protein